MILVAWNFEFIHNKPLWKRVFLLVSINMSASLSQREEQIENVSNRTIPKVLIQCEECKSNPSKYKCPGCSIQSCSLPCVKAHKVRTGCNGKRNQTQFVPITQFDDNILLSGTYSLNCVMLCLWSWEHLCNTDTSDWRNVKCLTQNWHMFLPLITHFLKIVTAVYILVSVW